MIKNFLFAAILISQLLFSKDQGFNSPFLTDSIKSDLSLLLNFEKISKKIDNKYDKSEFHRAVSFFVYTETLLLENNVKSSIEEYSMLINSLEERLDYSKTQLSYNLSAPKIITHFSHSHINRKNLSDNFFYNELLLLKKQYLDLLRYQENILNLCEERIDELLLLLDKTSLSRLYNDISLDKHIIVMNFSNLSKIEKYDKLISTFPEMIIKRYKDRKDVSVMRSGLIYPDVRKEAVISDGSRLLLDGSFDVEGDRIFISYKIYDVNSWVVIDTQEIDCDLRDIDCIYDSFLWNVEQSFKPLIKNMVYNDFEIGQKGQLRSDKVDSLYLLKKDDSLFDLLLEDFIVQKDYSFNINYKDFSKSETTLKTQSFDFSNNPNTTKNKEALLSVLTDSLLRFFQDPYIVDIGDMFIEINQDDNSYANLSVPVTYRIDNDTLLESLKNFPYNTLNSRKKLNIIEFLYDNYLFSLESIDVFNDYRNELFPVLFFIDKQGSIQKIIIDSWNNKYDDLLFGDYDVSRIQLFSQLYSLIESNNNMCLNFSSDTKLINYNVTMPLSILNNYTKLIVKIFTREDLDKYLTVGELQLRGLYND